MRSEFSPQHIQAEYVTTVLFSLGAMFAEYLQLAVSMEGRLLFDGTHVIVPMRPWP
jgi:hypothetical protein